MFRLHLHTNNERKSSLRRLIMLVLLPVLSTHFTNSDCMNRRVIIPSFLSQQLKNVTLRGHPPCHSPVQPPDQRHSSCAGLPGHDLQTLFWLSVSKGRAGIGQGEDLDLPSCDIPSAALPQISSWSAQSQLERGLRVWAALNFFLNSSPPACISKNKQNNFRYHKSEGFSSS